MLPRFFQRVCRFRMATAISEDLLVSLSMGQHQNFNTQKDLADYYYKNELITDKTLHQAFELLDRKKFSFGEVDCRPLYGNFPIKLNSQDNMTTPIMHIIPANYILTKIIPKLKGKQISFLDVGTGRGYLPQLLNLAFHFGNMENFHVEGIEIEQQLVQESQQVQSAFKDELQLKKLVKFVKQNLNEYENLDYSIINIGFEVTMGQVKKIQEISQCFPLYLICPLNDESSSEQWLTLCEISPTEIRTENIMKCVFQKQKFQSNSTLNLQKLQRLLENQTKIETFIKEWNQIFLRQNNIKPTLKDMKQDESLVNQLEELRKVKRQIDILKFLKQAE